MRSTAKLWLYVVITALVAVFAVSACNSINLWDEWQEIISQRNCSHEWGE
jgi:hypothetical protein